jgi:hypothetical protein
MNWLWNIGLDAKRKRRRSILPVEETTGGGCWNRTPRKLSSTPPIRIHLRLTQNHNKKFRHLLHSSFACLIPANVQSLCMVSPVVVTVERKTERRRVGETATGEATDRNYYYERKTNTHKPTHKGQHCNKTLINKKRSREGDDAARPRWVLQETTTTTPTHPTTANTHLQLQRETTATPNPSLPLRQSSNPKASNPN